MNAHEICQVFRRYYLGLIEIATNGSYPETDYSHDRTFILANTELRKLIPVEISQHFTAQSFRVAVQEKGGYAIRRQFITKALTPAINYIDGLISEADSFSLNEDSYEMGEIIGEGGFGVVHKNHHKLLDMDFAI